VAQGIIQRKRAEKQKWVMNKSYENRQENKEIQYIVTIEVTKTEQKAYDELYARFDFGEAENDWKRHTASQKY